MLHQYNHFPWRFRHPIERLNCEFGRVERVDTVDDSSLVMRITDAYRAAVTTDVGSTDNMWMQYFAAQCAAEHKALSDGTYEEVGAVIREPALSFLLHGFDGPTTIEDQVWAAASTQETTCLNAYDALLSLASALNVKRVENPEAGLPGRGEDVETLLQRMDERLGIRVDFPNIFRADIGVQTSRGVMTHRAIMSLYQAWRISEMVGQHANPRVMEIGAGLGRNAYYAFKLGIRDYTIIDLPTTNVAQAYFLGRTLGESAVSLFGESSPAYVKIKPPAFFLQSLDRYDLISNIDSMTEFSAETARQYVAHIMQTTPKFLSINHENNAFTVRELALERGVSAHSPRMPHWMRRGYVEEVFSPQS